MSDLVKRLRTVRWHEETESWMPGRVDELQIEAADRIDALETGNERLCDLLRQGLVARDRQADELARLRPRIEALEAALRETHAFLAKRPPNNHGWNALLNKLEALILNAENPAATPKDDGGQV